MMFSKLDHHDAKTIAYVGSTVGAIAAVAIAIKYFAKQQRVYTIDSLYDFNHQSIEIDDNEHIRVLSKAFNDPRLEYLYEDVRTLHDVLPKGMEISGNSDFLGYRKNGTGPYEWIKYSEVIEKTRFVGSALLNQGTKAENTTNIGIYSRNRPEWIICEHMCYSYSMVVVSLYDTYGKNSIKYILEHCEMPVVFLDTYARLLNVVEIAHELPSLRLIVYFDEINENSLKNIKLPSNVQLISFDNLMKIGSEYPKTPVPPKPSDVATICYTSGTTGVPKGAMITHANLISNTAAFQRNLMRTHLNIPGCDLKNPPITHYSYLPFAHMMERTLSIGTQLVGGKTGFISGDITKMPEDCQLLKPTDLALVPRLINKLYDRVKTQIGSSLLKSMLLKRAIAAKEADRSKGIIRQDTLYDRLIFQKIRNLFGGCILRSGTGSAPISKDVMEFARSCFSCRLPEAYGQTEATMCITAGHPFDPSLGHCGPPLDNLMVKLVDVPDMNYFSKDGKGEVCAKGPSIFKGYYKEPEKTAEAIDNDGWLHTGDIGMWLPNGCLKIIDRKKHLFKLSQGEYISPERVEHAYLRCPFIAQIFVEGDSLRDFCVAIVVPEKDYLINYCKKVNIHVNGSFEELCNNETIRKLILTEMNLVASKEGLLSFEKVRNIHLHSEPFSLENGYLTPTLKLKRLELRKQFKETTSLLYDEITKRQNFKND